jgi:hypothetical protein
MATQQAFTLNPKLLEALEENWQADKSGAYTYRTLAERESDPARSRPMQPKGSSREMRHWKCFTNFLPHERPANIRIAEVASR